MKPGYKTTEFWLSVVAMFVGVLLASGILDTTATTLDNQLVGMVAMLLTSLGYTASRALSKNADAKLEATKVLSTNPPQPPQQ